MLDKTYTICWFIRISNNLSKEDNTMYDTFDEYHEKVYDEILSKCKTARKYLLDKGDHPAMLTHFD